MTKNDGKIHLLLWVEILSLKSYFSICLLIYSTLLQFAVAESRRVFVARVKAK